MKEGKAISIDLFAADGDMLCASHFVWQTGETGWWWGFNSASFSLGILRYGLCNAKQVGTFNHIECCRKWKKRYVSTFIVCKGCKNSRGFSPSQHNKWS